VTDSIDRPCGVVQPDFEKTTRRNIKLLNNTFHSPRIKSPQHNQISPKLTRAMSVEAKGTYNARN
jgi:hypothetical protein